MPARDSHAAFGALGTQPAPIPASSHVEKVRLARLELERKGFQVDEDVVNAMSQVDMDAIVVCLEKNRSKEPAWKPSYKRFLNDSRVMHLAQGGYVFENLSVYMVLTQLLAPALREAAKPRVLDVGCGTGFLTAVLASLVAERSGHVKAIDIFERQVEHAQRDLQECLPHLLPLCSFEVCNAWTYEDAEGFDAIAVAAQCEELPQNLVRLLKPKGRLVCPLGPVVPIDSERADRFQPYWMVEVGADGQQIFSGRAGPLSVNFLPLIPPEPSV
ncbi:unnamed protein product [Effrenium voratum]|nr:unnamed protein product [Effrenium voratum]